MNKAHKRLSTKAVVYLFALMVMPVVVAPPAWPASATLTDARLDGTRAVRRPSVSPLVVRMPIVESDRPLIFRRITTADGLSQTRVAQIVQDDNGYMWFGTQSGLNRYDGYEFRVFLHDPANAKSIAGSFIYSLFKDRSGYLWIGCDQVLDRFDPRTETFEHFRIGSGGPEVLGGTVVHISQDRSGMLWLATATGLHRLNPATGKITHFRHSSENLIGLGTDDIKWSGEDRSGEFWVGTREGLDRFDRQTGTVKQHIPIPDAVRIAFFEDRTGNFWVLHATGSGLALYDRASNTLTQYSFYTREPPATQLTGVMDMVEDSDGNLWLGSMGVGLLRFDSGRRQFVHYSHRPEDPKSIAEDKVIALFLDRDGDIWTGLHSVGPNHFLTQHVGFDTFAREPNQRDSWASGLIGSLYADPRGVLWVGNDKGLNRIDRNSRTSTLTTAGLEPSPTVVAIAPDPNGTLWFGAYGNGVVNYDPRTNKYTVYRHDPADPASLSNDEVRRILFDHSGTMWLGTGNGLDRFDPVTQRFHAYRFESGDDQAYEAVAEDTIGTLWLGSRVSGLQRFDPKTGHFTLYKPILGDSTGLRDNTISSVLFSTSGFVWIGTLNGLNRLDPTTGKFAAYDVSSGMPGNAVSCVLEDDRGNIWMSTNKGVSSLNPVSQKFTNYSSIDGLPGDDLTGWGACSKSAQGEMFFGGFAGAVGFFPDKLKDSISPPPVIFTNFELAGGSVQIGADQPLTQAIAFTDSVTLRHDQNSLAVTFAGLRYDSPDASRYRYTLAGLDRGWYEVDSKHRRATYTTLPPGSYLLRVQSATSRGPWSEPGARLHIVILAPWWMSWWFRSVVGLALLLLVFAVYQYRMREVRRNFRIRFDAQLAERNRIARDLHDSLLQGVQGLMFRLQAVRRMLPARAEEAITALEAAMEAGDAAAAEGREAVQALRFPQVVGDDLVETLTALSEEGLHAAENTARPSFRVVVKGKPRALHSAVRDEVYHIAREALRNAFHHAQARETLVVIAFDESHLSIHIRDDGIGIDPPVLDDGGRAGHWGLPGMRERAASFGGELNIWSKRGTGTEVELTVPADIAYATLTERRRFWWSQSSR